VSSAILYVAIVAIWIGVLVPRFVYRDGTQSGASGLRRFSRHFGASRPADDQETPAASEPDDRAGFDPDGRAAFDADGRAGFDPAGRPRYTSFVPPEPRQDAPASHSESRFDHGENVSPPVSGNRGGMAQRHQLDAPPPPVRSYGWSADEVARQEHRNRRGASRSQDPAAAAGREAAPPPRAPRASYEPVSRARQAPEVHHDGQPRPATDDAYDEGYADDAYYDSADDAERRARMVRSRRRMLWLLLVLTVVGIALTYLQLASWWIIIPPLALLGGYLMLLREAAHADAEARERRAAEHATETAADRAGRARTARPSPSPAQAPPAHAPAAQSPAAATAETGPRAAVIDLSEHVNDQLYDQYADAKLRAVGD
jgi:hypothetical protein